MIEQGNDGGKVSDNKHNAFSHSKVVFNVFEVRAKYHRLKEEARAKAQRGDEDAREGNKSKAYAHKADKIEYVNPFLHG